MIQNPEIVIMTGKKKLLSRRQNEVKNTEQRPHIPQCSASDMAEVLVSRPACASRQQHQNSKNSNKNSIHLCIFMRDPKHYARGLHVTV
jgi:hypothetical protein